MNPERIFAEFPAPSYRGNQERALREIRDAFLAGNEVVLVRAPTGSGKSLLARAIAGCARRIDEAEPAEVTGAYYTTPQVSQLDDVAGEELLADLNIIRGKSNYTCILPGELDTPVNRAPCVRERGYDCSVKHRCPYFSDRSIAANRSIAAMTLAYFMQTAGSELFGKRDVVVIDEAHGLAEWAEMYATIELGPRTVPFWDELRVPAVDGVERTARYAENLVAVCRRRREQLVATESMTPTEVSERDRLDELIGELEWFVADYRDPESPTTWLVDQAEPAGRASGHGSDDGAGNPGAGVGAGNSGTDDGTGTSGCGGDNGTSGSAGGADGAAGEDGIGGPLTIKPMDPARYLRHTVWDRGNRFALLSATILDKAAFCRGVGLDPSRVALVDVPHTFPVENRPLYDVTRGKMTYEHREETLPNVARTIVRIMAAHPDRKGLVHAHSYAIADQLETLLAEFGVGERLRSHGREDRDRALESWKATDDPDVFLSVKMEEALDLEGELARWQVLCKAPFPNTGDSRVARRLEEGQWAWYYRTALRTVIQGCGRVVRAPDDYGATYLADSSLLDLFERARSDTPDWFREAIDRMERPELPAFDPQAALSGGSSDGGRTSGRRSRRRRSGGRSPVADVWETDG